MRNKVKELRLKSRKSLGEIAENIGVCNETVRRYEADENALLAANIITMIKYARELGVSADELLELRPTIKK